MRLTNEQILTITPDLVELQKSSIVLPSKVSYAILRNIRTLTPLYEDIESCRIDIAKRNSDYTTSLGDTGKRVFNIPKSRQEEVSKQINELLDVENDLEIYTFPLRDIEEYNLDMKSMNALYFMIEEGEG